MAQALKLQRQKSLKPSHKTHCEKQYIKTLCKCNESVIQTIREIGVTQLQVLAGASGVALCAQWVLHLLNLQFEGVERAKDFLHAVIIVLVVGIHSCIVHYLAGIDVSASSALHGSLDGEWMGDLARRSLIWRGEREGKNASER